MLLSLYLCTWTAAALTLLLATSASLKHNRHSTVKESADYLKQQVQHSISCMTQLRSMHHLVQRKCNDEVSLVSAL